MAAPGTARFTPRASGWSGVRGDCLGGVAAALFTLPGALAFGALVLAPLGGAHVAVGAAAGLSGAVVAGLVAALSGGTRGGITAPAGQLAILLATVVAFVASQPLDPQRIPAAAIALAAWCAVVAGATQLALGALRLGRLITYVPYPVIAGCAIGAALLIAGHQAAPLLGLSGGTPVRQLLDGAVTVHAGALLVGLAAVLGVFAGGLAPKVPDLAIGLACGWAMHGLLLLLAPDGVGPVIGALPDAAPWPHLAADVWRALHDEELAPLALRLVPAGVGIGVLGAVLSLVAAAIAESATRVRGDGSRELLGQGAANVLAGLSGGVPAALSETRTLIAWRAGGRGRLAAVAHAGALLAAATLAAPLLARLPQAVLAGLLLVSTLRAIDPWAVDLVRLALRRGEGGRLPPRELALNLVVVALVAGLTVGFNLFWGLGAGLVIAVVQFIASMSGSPVRRVLRGDSLHSKAVRSAAATAVLGREGRVIAVLELQGPLFFGTADRLAREAEALLGELAVLVLDLKRVTGVDSSGARIVQRLHEECAAQGRRLSIAHLVPGSPAWAVFAGLGVVERIGADSLFPDVDAALQDAEDALLRRLRGDQGSGGRHALDGLEVVDGLAGADLAVLSAYLVERRHAAGAAIFREGEPGDELFILLAGEVSVRTRLEDGRDVRLSAFTPGVVFGEMALLEHAPRSATVLADRDAVTLGLTVEAYGRLGAEHPAIALRLALNLGRQLAGRLRRANGQIRALEQ
jgi:SulP family sulfate permease